MNNNENAIREAAYYIWQDANCPEGKDELFWTMATEQMNSCCSSKSKSTACKKTTCKKAAATASVSKPAAKKATVKKAK